MRVTVNRTAAAQLLKRAEAASSEDIVVPTALLRQALQAPRVGLYQRPEHTHFEEDSTPSGRAWIAFLSAWHERHGSRPVSIADLVKLAEFTDVAGSERRDARVLGRLLALRSHMGYGGRWRIQRVRDGYDYKVKGGYRYRSPTWSLVETPG